MHIANRLLETLPPEVRSAADVAAMRDGLAAFFRDLEPMADDRARWGELNVEMLFLHVGLANVVPEVRVHVISALVNGQGTTPRAITTAIGSQPGLLGTVIVPGLEAELALIDRVHEGDGAALNVLLRAGAAAVPGLVAQASAELCAAIDPVSARVALAHGAYRTGELPTGQRVLTERANTVLRERAGDECDVEGPGPSTRGRDAVPPRVV